MKKNWVRPLTTVQSFTANEYVAVCGETEKVYKFTCDATGGELGFVFQETNGKEGLQVFGDTLLTPIGGYSACGKEHEAPVTDDFVKGYYITSVDGINATPVIIWRGEDGKNVHCTKNLNMDKWETAKS